jgi:hypothetical protein
MELALFIYLSNLVPSLANSLAVIAVIAGILSIVYGINWAIDVERKVDTLPVKKTFKVVFTVLLFSWAMAVLVPNQRTMWMMAAGYAGQQVVTSEVAQETAQKLNKIIQGNLDSIIAGMNQKPK